MNSFLILTICVTCVIIGYFAGYINGYANGFNKCKKIDDDIIEELSNKYKIS